MKNVLRTHRIITIITLFATHIITTTPGNYIQKPIPLSAKIASLVSIASYTAAIGLGQWCTQGECSNSTHQLITLLAFSGFTSTGIVFKEYGQPQPESKEHIV